MSNSCHAGITTIKLPLHLCKQRILKMRGDIDHLSSNCLLIFPVFDIAGQYLSFELMKAVSGSILAMLRNYSRACFIFGWVARSGAILL